MGAPNLRRRFLWLLPVLVLGAATVLLQGRPPEVDAHALLVKADPPVNSALPQPPTELSLYFSEALEHKFSSARVVDQDNKRVDDVISFDDADDTLMHVSLKPVSPGYITVFWENVSAVDGHRISGSYPLTILNPDGSTPAGKAVGGGVSTSGTGANPARVASKAFLLLAGCLLTGAFAFLAWVTPSLPGADGERARRAIEPRVLATIGVSIVVLAIAGAAELLFEASYIHTNVATLLGTRWGSRWLLRNLLLIVPAVLLAIAWFEPGTRRLCAWAGLAAAVAYLAIVSSVSHGAAGAGSFWSAGSDFVHLLAASIWIGMLAELALLLFWARTGLIKGERYPVIATALQRFSVVAVVSLALLLFTGTVNSVIELGHAGDLLNTGYGRALLIKLLLVLPLLVVGGINAYILRPRFVDELEAGGRDRAANLASLETRLLQMMRYELGLAIMVLAVVGVLVQLSPTKGQSSSSSQPAGKYTATKDVGDVSATIVVDPNEAGINSFELYLTGAVDTVENARLDFKAAKSADESRLVLDASNPPTFYVGKGPYLAEPGKWTIVVDLRRTKGADTSIPFEVSVRGAGGVSQTVAKGGSFAAPIHFTSVGIALIALSGLTAVWIILGSRRREGMTAGYMGEMAEEVAYRVEGVRLRPVWSLAALIVVGIGLGIILGSHVHGKLSPQQATQGNPIASSPESIERGRVLFEANCTQCHGESGRGDGPLASSLPIKPANLYDHVPYHPDDFFESVIKNGLSGVMPAFGNQISDDDRWNILNFLRSRFTTDPAVQ